jgi:hypothetical protein
MPIIEELCIGRIEGERENQFFGYPGLNGIDAARKQDQALNPHKIFRAQATL